MSPSPTRRPTFWLSFKRPGERTTVETALQPDDPSTATLGEITRTAYRIACGPWLLAFDLAWATHISETFSLNPIPRAPAWLVGCTSADGLLVPVVDLLLLIDPQAQNGMADVAISRREKSRLLLGSHSAGENEEALGLLFNGLPQQISFTPQALPADMPLPAPLKAVALGLAQAADGLAALDLDTRSLIDLCMGQLDAADALFVHP